ncbi:hypothetical protein G7A66_09355 [Altererythrobacter sp. SALINAS58]|uniref:DUF5681 domain-containing protein n=1 Tax=Alteripontixanthobacter muriae TaxID=2705546 RepID=UPI001575BD50|nr:DUF5681 domain-containing protein [Alteripontixanthobacter muriae]NTZ43288.1 hypothetical protein [Alteripontixanthobacter muriae]
MEQEPLQPGKRTDVGYKRPPREHQFKKGQKPPPRRRKEKSADSLRPSELLWGILQEERRVTQGGKVRWMSNSELLMHRAHELAQKGNPTIRRLLLDLMMAADPSANKEHIPTRMVVDGVDVTNYRT